MYPEVGLWLYMKLIAAELPQRLRDQGELRGLVVEVARSRAHAQLAVVVVGIVGEHNEGHFRCITSDGTQDIETTFDFKRAP